MSVYFSVQGKCVRYNGTACSHVHGRNSYVFLNLSHSHPFQHQEQMAQLLLDEMFAVDTTQKLKDRCNGHGENLICNYIFPPCDPDMEKDLAPKPVPVCRYILV